MHLYLGELAALGTSLAFAVTSMMFTLAGRQVGSMVVNRTRLLIAVLLLTVTHWLVLGQPWPLDADPERWMWLGLSGIVGLVLGDAFLFQAFVWIGPRLSMLLMSLAPVIAALTAWIFLGETLSGLELGGILLALLGVAWVIFDQGNGAKTGNQEGENRSFLRGILFGLGGATGQAVGLVLAKNGLVGDFSPISANVIRMVTAATLIWVITLIRGQARSNFVRLNTNRRALIFLFAGTLGGPFIGVSLSLFAVQHAEVGVASTLMALSPVFLLPVSYLFFKERFGWGAVVGTLLAIAGVTLIFFA